MGEGVSFEACLEQYRPLVKRVVRELYEAIQSHNMDYEDAEQEAIIALYTAYTRFDPSREVRFITFAYHYMIGGVRRALRDRGRLIRRPRTIHDLYIFCRKRDIKTFEELKPYIAELVSKGYSADRMEDNFKLAHSNDNVQYLDTPLTTEEGESTFMDFVGSDEEGFAYSELKTALDQAGLTEHERCILERHIQGYTQTEIAKVVGVSQVSVGRALVRVRKKLEKLRSEGYVLV